MTNGNLIGRKKELTNGNQIERKKELTNNELFEEIITWLMVI